MTEQSDRYDRPEDDVAVDADRAPRDPEQVAGRYVPDPWDLDPDRWAGTEPTPLRGDPEAVESD